MAFMDDFNAWVSDAAKQFGVSTSYLQTTARIESGLNPNAAGGGLFQFRGGAMQDVGLSNPLDPRASTFGAASYGAINTAALTKALGRAPADWEVYLAHQQGAGGAAKILTNPGAYASDAVSNFMGNINAAEFKKLTGVDVNNPAQVATAGDFATYWMKKYQSISGSPAPAVSIPALGGSTSQTTTAAAAAGLSSEIGALPTSNNAGGDTSTWMTWGEHQLVRGAVVITGFILLAAGLGMFALGAVFRSEVGRNVAGGAIAGAIAGRVSRPKADGVSSAPGGGPTPVPLTRVDVEPPRRALPAPTLDAAFEDLTPPPVYVPLPDSGESAERARFNLLTSTNKGFREFVKDKPQESDADLAGLHRGFFPGAKQYVREEQSAAAKRMNESGPQSSLIEGPSTTPSFWQNVGGALNDTALTSNGRKKIAAGWNELARINKPKKERKVKVTPLTDAERAAISKPSQITDAEGFTVGQQVRLKDVAGKGRTDETFTVTEMWRDPKHGVGVRVKGTHSGEGYFPLGEIEAVPQALRPIRKRVRETLLKVGALRDFTKPKK